MPQKHGIHSQYALDRIRIARRRVLDFALVHAIRQTEAAVAALHLLLELRQTVEERHHGRIKLGVPEELEAAGAVQRQLFATLAQHLDVRMVAERHQPIAAAMIGTAYKCVIE